MNILYNITYALVYVFSLLPFRVLYFISDGLYLLIYRIVGYRKKVVRRNLTTSFPEKGIDEIKSIERGFYHFLCDYFMETVKLLSISPETLAKHIEYKGVEAMEDCFEKGQSCAAILGHYCNWEYLTTVGKAFKRHPEAVVGLIYHPLYNNVADKLFIDIRQHSGGVCVPKKDILRYLVTYRRDKKMSLFGYISDQVPKWNNIHLWLPFLNHDTPVFTNGEKIMRKMNNAVFYCEMSRPERGKYVVNFKPITLTPGELEENAITIKFFSMLEETICREPRYYLWSHNRWKRTHEEFDKRYKVVNGKVLPKDN